MRFIKNYTVRWHDTGADRVITPSRLVEFMQESASLHCRSLGHDLDEMRDKEGLGFVVTRLSYEVLASLYAQDEITVETWVPESYGLFFNRCYEVKKNGTVVARGISVSALLDLKTRKFLRVSDYDFGFEVEDCVRLSDGIPMRLRLAQDQPLTHVGMRKIACSDLDYNLHMNNTHYPDMLADHLPDRTDRRVVSMVVSYLGEAHYGDTLSVACGVEKGDESESVFCLRATREDGTVVTEARIATERISQTLNRHTAV